MARLANAEKAYELFDTWIEEFVLGNKSILTPDAPECFDPDALHSAIVRFVEDFRPGKEDFQKKLSQQFEDALEDPRQILAHAHWLWSLTDLDIGVKTKMSHVAEILNRNDLRQEVFIPGFQNSGTHHKTNKHNEISAILRIFEVLVKLNEQQQLSSVKDVKTWIEQICLFGRYQITSDRYPLTDEMQAIIPTKTSNKKKNRHLQCFTASCKPCEL